MLLIQKVQVPVVLAALNKSTDVMNSVAGMRK